MRLKNTALFGEGDSTRLQPSVAVIDTGFWGICCRLNLARHLTKVWATPILMPGAVIAELFAKPARTNPITGALGATWFLDQQAFLDAVLAGTMQPENADHHYISGFNRGERDVIDLALELATFSGNLTTVLINERRAHEFANRQPGLIAISVPEFLVDLHDRGILSMIETVTTFNQLAAMGRTPRLFMTATATEIRTRGGSV